MKRFNIVMPREDGGVEVFPMKQWLRGHPTYIPPGLNAMDSTSHQLRDGLRRAGWQIQETDAEVRLIHPGPSDALNQIDAVLGDGDGEGVPTSESASKTPGPPGRGGGVRLTPKGKGEVSTSQPNEVATSTESGTSEPDSQRLLSRPDFVAVVSAAKSIAANTGVSQLTPLLLLCGIITAGKNDSALAASILELLDDKQRSRTLDAAQRAGVNLDGNANPVGTTMPLSEDLKKIIGAHMSSSMPDFVSALLSTMDPASASSLPGSVRLARKGKKAASEAGASVIEENKAMPHDDAEAVKSLRRAADQGDADAQVNLGAMYHDGRGVPQDDTEAVKWYRRAADQGHAAAQFNLGLMYENGRGVPQDDTEALKWLRRAADGGYADAQFAHEILKKRTAERTDRIRILRLLADGDALSRRRIKQELNISDETYDSLRAPSSWLRVLLREPERPAAGALG